MNIKNTVNELIRIYLLNGQIGPQNSSSVVYRAGDNFKRTGVDGNVVATGSSAATVIQAAINALPSTGGKLMIKAGSYTLTSAITIGDSDIIIEGEGSGTLLRYDGADVATVFSMADATQRTNIEFRDFKLLEITGTSTSTGFDLNHFAICKLENLWIQDMLIPVNLNGTDCLYNHVQDCRILPRGASSIGVAMQSGANENTLLRLRIQPQSNSTGVLVDAHANGLYDVDVESTASIGIDVASNGNDTNICGVYLEANATNLRLASGVEGFCLFGGFIADGTTANITDNGAKDPFIYCRLQYDSYVQYPFSEKGTGTINSGSTSAVITHGLNWTPVASEIVINFTENPTNTPGAMWIDTITSTQFTVNVENDPGASNLDFGWSARKIT